MNIAVIGKGAREDAISQKLISEGNKVFLINNNNVRDNNIDIDVNDFDKIKFFCIEKKVELIIVGPEDLLANGIVDYFSETEIDIFGPNKEASKLESSKIFAKEFMCKYGVSTAEYSSFDDVNDNSVLTEIERRNGVLALKYDGLAAGKGVFISDNLNDAYKNLELLKTKYLNDENLKFIIEDKLEGREISIMAVTDSKSIRLFQASQDYKLSKDYNKGLNTGGMGAITPLDFVDKDVLDKIKKDIVQPTLKGLKKENNKYLGFLYFGIILTSKGPYLLEYNVRMGDPETQVLLPSLKSSFTKLIMDTINNKLDKSKELVFDDKYYISLVLASMGYPLKYNSGDKITIISQDSSSVKIYYAGVKRNSFGDLLTNGGRVLNIVASSKDVEEVKNSVYSYAKGISFASKYFRRDIGIVY